MEKVEDYRPDEIEFTAESSQVPNELGQFETEEEARMFMAENLLAVQTKLQTERFMDQYEIERVRESYSDELENNLPLLRENMLKKADEFEQAKQSKKDAEEMVNASLNKVQQLANEVNDRTTEIELDPSNTWEVIYNAKKYYYALMDGVIKLAKVEDIPSYQVDDLVSTSEKNAEYFERLKKASNE